MYFALQNILQAHGVNPAEGTNASAAEPPKSLNLFLIYRAWGNATPCKSVSNQQLLMRTVLVAGHGILVGAANVGATGTTRVIAAMTTGMLATTITVRRARIRACRIDAGRGMGEARSGRSSTNGCGHKPGDDDCLNEVFHGISL